MSRHRLSIIAPDLYATLGETSEAQLKVIMLCCCRFAAKQTDLSNLIVAETIGDLGDLEQGRTISRAAVDEIERLTNWLDDKYFRQQEVDEYQSEQAFCKARAASSLRFASQADTGLAVEVVYEVIAATDDLERVSQIVEEALVKEKQ